MYEWGAPATQTVRVGGRPHGARRFRRAAAAPSGHTGAMPRALIVVDVQNDFCPGGTLAVDGGDRVAAAITAWLAADGHRYDLVVATRDWHPSPAQAPDFAHFADEPDWVDTWPRHCVAGTPGAEPHPSLVLPADAVVVRKGQVAAAYSGFEGYDGAGTPLAELLARRSIDAVDVVGLATDHCVRATALDARALGLAVDVRADLVAGVAPATTDRALAELRAAGVVVVG